MVSSLKLTVLLSSFAALVALSTALRCYKCTWSAVDAAKAILGQNVDAEKRCKNGPGSEDEFDCPNTDDTNACVTQITGWGVAIAEVKRECGPMTPDGVNVCDSIATAGGKCMRCQTDMCNDMPAGQAAITASLALILAALVVKFF